MAKTVDLRTYLLLEKAFVRRLQRTWRIHSAPIYASITQACLDHNWNEARRLVPDLDMAEVGTQNREWISYMLLSCAVFGANTVAKGKPSFVGVGTFDTFLKQTTNNMLQYLEYTATSQVQQEALQSIAEDEAKTKALKVAYDPDQVRDARGRFAREGHHEHSAIGIIHRGVVRVRDLKGRDPYGEDHQENWQIDVIAAGRFRYDRGKIIWLDHPNADDYFAVDDYFANMKWPIKGHYDQTRGYPLSPPVPKVAWDESKHPRDKDGRFVYHHAPVTARASIAQSGLDPNRDKTQDRKKVFFTTWPEYDEALDVWEADTTLTALEASMKTRIPGGEAWFTSEEAIPASQLRWVPPEEVKALQARRTKKWDEAKHPRDKEGQFTEAGHAVDVEGRTGMEGGGPERAIWENLNDRAIEADEAYSNAKEAHKAVEARLKKKYQASGRLTGAGLVNSVLNDPEYLESDRKWEEAAEVVNAAERALKAQEPAMRVEVITNLASSVAKELGIDPSIIDVVYIEPRAFDVGTKHFTEAGHFSSDTGRIEINARNISYGDVQAVKGIAAHEISHVIYHALRDEAEREQVWFKSLALVAGDSDSYTPWFHERFIKMPTGQTVKPEYQEEIARDYPASTVMAQMNDGKIFGGISEGMIKENGHSRYAKSYWDTKAVMAKGTYESAINETIAEITRYITYPASWKEEHRPPTDSPWSKLTVAMHEWYRKNQP